MAYGFVTWKAQAAEDVFCWTDESFFCCGMQNGLRNLILCADSSLPKLAGMDRGPTVEVGIGRDSQVHGWA